MFFKILTNVLQVIILATTKLIVKILTEVFNACARMDILGMEDSANVSCYARVY